MGKKVLIEKMLGTLNKVPASGEVIGLRQLSLKDSESRARHFIAKVGEAFQLPLEKFNRVERDNRTLFYLPRGNRAVVYHASGALKLVSNLNPMETLFKEMPHPKKLTSLLQEAADRLELHQWVRNEKKERLEFERLWQIKAAAGDKEGNKVDPVLCRIVGAFRHYVKDVPVWGPASVALKLAGGGMFDSLTVQLREVTAEVLERPKLLVPEKGAEILIQQLRGVFNNEEVPLDEVFEPKFMKYGYLNLPKRKPQRVLAPVYLAAFETIRQEDRQAYLFVTPATEKAFMAVNPMGEEALPVLETR